MATFEEFLRQQGKQVESVSPVTAMPVDDPFIEFLKRDRQREATVSGIQGSTGSPAEAGKVIELGKKLGVDPNIIGQQFIKAYEEQERAKQAGQYSHSAEMQLSVLKDQISALATSGELHNLDRVRKSVKEFDNSIWRSAEEGFKAGYWGWDDWQKPPAERKPALYSYQGVFNALFNPPPDATPEQIEEHRKSADAWARSIAGGPSGMLGRAIGQIFTLPTAVGAAAGSALINPLQASIASLLGKKPEEIDERAKKTITAMAGIAENAQIFPGFGMYYPIAQFKNPYVSPVLPDQRITLSGRLSQFEAYQVAKRLVEEHKARVKADPEPGQVPSAEAIAELNRGRLVEPGLDLFTDNLYLLQQKIDEANLDRIMADAESFATKKNAPTVFADLIRRTVDRDILISTEAIEEIYRSKKTSPRPDDGLFGYVDNLEAQMQYGEVQIPLADYITRTPLPVHDSLKGRIRFREAGITGEEAVELEAAVIAAETRIKERRALEAEVVQAEKAEGTPIKEAEVKEATIVVPPKEREIEIGVAEELDPYTGLPVIEARDVTPSARLVEPAEAVEVPPPPEGTPEDIMNRVAKQKRRLFLSPAIENAKALGITEQELKNWSNRYEKHVKDLFEKAKERALQLIGRRRTADYKREQARIAADVEVEVNLRPDIRADWALRTGKDPFGNEVFEHRLHLDEDQVAEILPGHQIDSIVLRKDGADPNFIADQLGYSSAEALLRDLNTLHRSRTQSKLTPGKYRDEIVKYQTEVRTLERHGDLHEILEAEARLMALDEVQISIMADETRFIKRYMKEQKGIEVETLSRDDMQAYVDGTYANQVVGETKSQKFLEREIKRAEVRERKALGEQKFEEAIKAAQERTMYAMELQKRRELETLQATYAATVRRLVKKATGRAREEGTATAGVDQDAMNMIHYMFERTGTDSGRVPGEFKEALEIMRENLGVASKDPKEVLKRYEQLNVDNLQPLEVPQWFYDADKVYMEAPQVRIMLKDMTTQQFQEFVDLVHRYEHHGRDLHSMVVGSERMRVADVRASVVERIMQRPYRDARKDMGVRGKLIKAIALHTRPEVVLNELDLGNYLGPLVQSVAEKVAAAQYREFDLFEDFSAKMGKINKDLSILDSWKWRRSLNSSVEQDFIIDWNDPQKKPVKLNKSDIIWMALNLGSESNTKAYVRGWMPRTAIPEWDKNLMTEAQYKRLVMQVRTRDELTFEAKLRDLVTRTLQNDEASLNYIQGIFDVYADARKLLHQMERDIAGVPLRWVDPKPFRIGNRVISGGYFPIIHDAREVSAVMSNRSILESTHMLKMMRNTRWIARAEDSTKRVTLFSDPETTGVILKEQLHDIAFRRSIIDIDKILGNKAVQDSIIQYYGKQYNSDLQEWYKGIVNRDNTDLKSLDAMNHVFRVARETITTTFVAGSLNVAVSPDPGGAPFRWPRAISNMAMNMFRSPESYRGMYKFAYDRSFELRHEKYSVDQDVTNMLTRVTKSGYLSGLRNSALEKIMIPTIAIQRPFKVAVWTDAFAKGLDLGLAESDAARRADTVLRNTFGSQTTVSMAPIFRSSNEMTKTFVFLQRFANNSFNRTLAGATEFGRGARTFSEGERMEGTKGMMRGSNKLFWAIMPPALIGGYMFWPKYENQSHSEFTAKSVFAYMGQMTPFIGPMVNLMMAGYSPRSPFGAISETYSKMILSLMGGRKKADNWMKEMLTGVAVTLGMVGRPIPGAGQIIKDIDYINDVRLGKQSGRTFMEIQRGLRTGESKQKWRRE